jgi:ABC-type multidrug transport system fused ATPase/permease subunit
MQILANRNVVEFLGAWLFLRYFIEFVQFNQVTSTGHYWALALLLSSLFSSVCIHQLYGECAKEGIRVKAGLTALIYRKALTLARVRGGAGEVVNIVSTDVARIQDAVLNFHFLWTSAFETIIIICIAFYEIGISAFTSLGIIILLMPIQIYLGNITSETQRHNTETTSNRVHIMSEVLTAIKLIKFYAWVRFKSFQSFVVLSVSWIALVDHSQVNPYI